MFSASNIRLYALFSTFVYGVTQAQICFPNLNGPAHGAVSYTGITAGSVAILTCDIGYELNGNNNTTCTPPDWSPALGTCDLLQISCPTPPNVTNGVVNYTSTALNAKANITCNTGYVINGQPDMTCQSDGSWRNSGLCDPVNCGNILVVTNGVGTFRQGTRYPANATVTCRTGYVIQENNVVQCLATGSWDTPPQCFIDCGIPPTVCSGTVQLQTNNTFFNETAKVCCDVGYVSNTSQIACQESGEWETAACSLIVAKYQLYYFPLRGRGQAIRYLFVDNDIEYEEINVRDCWATKYKPMMPFGQVPMVKDGDQLVAQSNSILRYLGRKHDLYPNDPAEALKLDMITDHVEDIRGPYVRMIYTNYESGKDDFVKSLAEKFGYIENLFSKWGTEFISSKISFADYNLFDLLDDMMILSPTCLEGFPTLKANYERMASRPAIKKHRETEEFKNMPVNGNGKQ